MHCLMAASWSVGPRPWLTGAKPWRAIASDLVVYGMNPEIYCCDAVTCFYGMNPEIYCCDAVTCFAVTSSSYCEQCV